MKRDIVLALVLIAFPVAAGSAATHDWPQWRGQDRDAISAETGLVDRWPEDGPTVVWRADVGAGYSAVAISRGRVFTLGDADDAQYLFGIDADDGKEIWRREVGTTFSHAYGDGPRSTPLVDGKLVFAIGTAGRLVAVQAATGKLAWQHDLAAEFGARLPTFGFSSSPLVVGKTLVVEAGGKDGTFMAFDKTNGEVVWATHDDDPAYSSPVFATIHGVDQVIFWSAHGLHAVGLPDGRVLWKHDSGTFCPASGDPLNTGTPILVGDDRVFIASGSGAQLLQIRQSKDSESPFTVEPLWQTQQMRSDVNSAVLVENALYGFNRGILQCIDVRTGEVRWSARGFGRGSLIAADGKLIVFGESGNLALVEVNPDSFVQIDSAQVLDGRNWTSPALANGRLYLRGNETLLCLDLKKPSKR